MLALCREQRLEHRTKHIALRYFLAHELQQRGQLRLAYVASEANTADVFTKALTPCDHQRFCTQLGRCNRWEPQEVGTAWSTITIMVRRWWGGRNSDVEAWQSFSPASSSAVSLCDTSPSSCVTVSHSRSLSSLCVCALCWSRLSCLSAASCSASAVPCLIVSSSVARDSRLAPPPWSPLPALSSRYGLPCPCLWSPQVPPSPSSGACPHLCSLSPASRAASPVRTVRAGRVSRLRLPPVSGTHSMTLRPSTAPQRVPLPSPPASSLPDGPDPAFDSLRAASPTVTRFLATAVTDPLFESFAASALVAELVDFAAACRLDFATSLVAESASVSVCPPSVGGECALGTDVLEDRQEEFECFAASVPHLVSMLLAPEGDPDALDIPTPRSYAEAIEGPYSSQWQAAMDAEMASWKSTGTYVDEVPPPGANIVSGMWIFRVKRPPGSPPAFKARNVARGFSQRQGVDFFQTFSPTPKMTTLRVLLHVAAQRDYELHSLDFSTAFLQGSLHEEIWLRRPPGFTGSFHAGTQWSLRRPVYGLRQAPREWHDTLRTTLASLGFSPSTADPSLFLRTDATLLPLYVLVYVDDLVFATADTEALAHVKAQRTITLTQSHMVQQVLQRFGFTFSSPQSTSLPTGHSLSAPPSDESVEPSGPYPELVGCLMYLMTCTRPDLAYPLSLLARYVAPGRHRKVHWDAAKRVLRYLCSTSGMGLVLGGRARVVLTGHADASWVDDLATQRSSQGYTFSLGSGSVSWRSTRSSSVLSSSCEAEIYAGAMAAQELRWLTYLLIDLGEAPRSPPVLYVDNKAMLALCQEHRLEHRTKHIALRYFLARELMQRGQLHLGYVASQANTADVFTKALQPCPSAPSATAATTTAATAATAPSSAAAAPAYCATMASLRVLAFDHEGRPIQFDTWLDDLQLYLLSDNKDGVSLFDHVSGAATAPATTADSATCSQWLSCDAAAHLVIRNHLPLAECAHFGQHRTTQALYDTALACYSSPATAALGRLLLPYLLSVLSAFATVKDLVSHLPASDARYRAAVPAEDHFLSLDPSSLTVDLLEQHLLAAETSAVAVGAAHGTPRPPFFEGCSPSPLAPSYASAAAGNDSVAEEVGAASASAKRRSGKGKGGKGGGGGSGGGGGGSGSSGGGSSGGGGGRGTGGGGGGGGGNGGSGGGGGSGTGGGGTGARCVGSGGGQRQQHCPYVIRTGVRAGQTCGKLHTQHRCFSRLDDAWRAEFGDDVELPHWADLLRSRIAIFDLDFDAILSAMYALSVSAAGDCYRCVPPDPGIAAAALDASESGTLPSTAPTHALHTFMLDSGASACFFRDSTTLTPLSTPVLVRLADPFGGLVVACSSTLLPCPAVASGSLSGLHLPSFSAILVSTTALQDAMVTTTTPGGQRVTICTCTRTRCHLATFTRRPGSSLYTLATEPPQVAACAQESASGHVAASCLCRFLSHQTLMWHHRLGHPSLPRLRGMHSRLIVCGLPKSLPPLQPSPVPPCLPCVEGRQRAAPHSSSFPPTTAPLQTLHMDVKGQVVDVLIPWIRTVRLQLRERVVQDLPVLRLHSYRGVMEVARTSMIHSAAPHFLWPFAVRCVAHQLNLWPRVSLPETSPTLRWTGEVGNASVFRVWGSRAFVRDMTADKLSPRAIPCVFLGSVPDAPSWQFYHPTSRRVFSSQDVTFDESVPYYRLFPYRSAPPPPSPLFLAPGPPPVDPLPPKGPAPSGVSQVHPLPGPALVQVADGSGAARGAASGGAEPRGAESERAETGGS
ncbi:unnamed protein product [Closterium sp. NIES-54]